MRKIILFSILIIAGVCLIFSFPPLAEKGEKPNDKPKQPSNIVVFSPIENDEIDFPFKIKGEARVFENVLNLRLTEKDGEVLFEDFVVASSPDIGQFGPFEKEINYLQKTPKDEDVILKAFWFSPKDGSEIDIVSIPLKLKVGEINTLKLFFNNDKLDPEFSCNKVFPVERIVSTTQTPARLALELLLAGTTQKERETGFLTSINYGVKIQRLVIENGVARVDFDEQLEFQVGGSCRVAAIRTQITQTLKQFPTVKEVIISIDGRTEDILQP